MGWRLGHWGGLILCIACAGCGRIGYDPLPTDAPTDAGRDAMVDASMPDATSMDGAVDAGADLGVDAETDAGPDAFMDAELDADVDAAMDAEMDAAMDADSGPPPTPSVLLSRTSGVVTTEFGMSDTFTVVLTAPPSDDVTIDLHSSNTLEATVAPATLTFTAATWNIAQTVTATGVDDFSIDGDQPFVVVLDPCVSADSGYSGIDPDDVTGTNHDDETAGIVVVTAGALATAEWGQTAEFSILLQARPLSAVTVPLASTNTLEGTVASSVTFTPDNWSDPQVVTITGVDDVRDDGDVAYAIQVGPATGDSAYVGVTAADIDVVNLDDDTSCILLSPTSLVTNELGMTTATFDVSLCSQPVAGVLFSIASGDTSEGTVAPAAFSMTAATWNTPRTITVTGVDDALADGNVTFNVSVTPTSADPVYGALPAQNVSVVNVDDELAGITVSPVSGLTTSEAGSSSSFTIRLNTMPMGDVTIGLTSSTPAEGQPDVSSVTITPLTWMTPRTVTVLGQDDLVDDGSVGYTIVTATAVSTDGSYNGLNAADVSVTNLDNDTAGVVVTPTSGVATTESGGFTSFSVRLASQPTADVTIALSSSDATEGLPLTASLTFTSGNWNVPQSVNVQGQDDALVDGTQIFQIVTAPASSADATYNGIDPSDVTISNFDNDLAAVVVSPTSGVVTNENGLTSLIFLVLTSAPVADVTIPISSGMPSEVSVSTASVTFTPMNWNVYQSVTVTGLRDNVFDSDAPFTIVTGNASSADPNYNNIPVADVTGSNLHAMEYFKASNANANDGFGEAVAISGDGNTMAVGATGESSNATGVGGDQANNASALSGAVYVFRRVAGTWMQEAYIKGPNSDIGDSFGDELALSHDGSTLAVVSVDESSNATGIGGDSSNNAAPASGAVFVFRRTVGAWAQEAYVKASNAETNDFFGRAVTLTDDGNTMVVGAVNERSNATGIGGNQSNNSLLTAGAAYVFVRSGVAWSQAAYVKASNTGAYDAFGSAVRISGDGSTLAVGAPGESSASPGINGNQADNSLYGVGAIYLFVQSAGVWSQQAYIKPAAVGQDGFARSLALSTDGNTLAAGGAGEASNATTINGDASNNSAPSSGAVWIFSRVAASWSQQAFLKTSNSETGDSFGSSVDISDDGNTLVAGAIGEDSNATRIGTGSPFNNSITSSGAAYIFTRSGATWSQNQYIKPWLGTTNQYFGYSVGLDGAGHSVAIGAYATTQLSTGINNYCVSGPMCGVAPYVGAVTIF